MRKLISLVIPVFNEKATVPVLYQGVIKVWQSEQKRYDLEIIFIDDGSADKSLEAISHLAAADQRVKYLSFSRNFGKEIATTAGIEHASGQAVVIMDGDGQHPPKFIPLMLRRWEKGAEIVVGLSKRQEGATLGKRIGSGLFYQIYNTISPHKMRPHETDFRLLDKIVVEQFKKFTEHSRLTRGLTDWLGFRRDYFEFTAPRRLSGQPGYNYARLTRLAITSLIGGSLLPLKIAGYLGIFITLIFGLFGLFIIIEKYLLDDPWRFNFSGPAILAVIVAFLVGVILSCLGLIALYIGNIYEEVTNRPLYVIRRKGNLPK